MHFVKDRCRNTDEECPFSHNERDLSEAQLITRRKAIASNNNDDFMDEDLPDYEDTLEEGPSGSHSQYGNMARRSRKRPRLVDYPDTTSNSMDTSNFPEPVPAVRNRDYGRARAFSHSPRGDRRTSGNANGAQGYRSDLVSPERRRRGSSRSRGSSMSRGGNPRGKPQYSPRSASRRDPRERRWDRASELRREDFEERDSRRRW